MKSKYWDLVSGSCVLLLAIVLYIGSTQVKTLSVTTYGANFFPAIVAGLLAIVSVPIIVGGIKKAKAPDKPAEKSEGKPRAWAVFATFGLMAAYAGLLPLIGFIIMTVVYLFLQMLILVPRDKRNFLSFGIISVIASVVIYYTFVKVFQLMLPAGILG